MPVLISLHYNNQKHTYAHIVTMQQTVDPSGGRLKCEWQTSLLVLLTLILNLHLNVSFERRNVYVFLEELNAGIIST